MYSTVHILCSDADQGLDSLKESILASKRVRLAPLYEAALAKGLHVTIGEDCPLNVDLLVVGKIKPTDLSSRARHWLGCITACKLAGGTVILDYTDHHCATESDLGHFYRVALQECSAVLVPSDSIGLAVRPYLKSQPTFLVEDFCEYDALEPKRHAVGESTVAMWFGHETNFDFFEDFLVNRARGLGEISFNIVSSAWVFHRLVHLKKQGLIDAPVFFTEWNKKAMIEIARRSDLCFIPSDVESRKKTQGILDW